MNNQYFDQVGLLLELLPIALSNEKFGLKGGTAINLFFRDMERLSVDIDLCYLPIESRESTLISIDSALQDLSNQINRMNTDYKIEKRYTKAEEAKNLIVHQGKISVKIEINLVVRGSVYSCVDLPLCEFAKNQFSKNINARCLSFSDVYGGKLCATLDRQHPRDWYDTWVLLENEGVTEDIRKAFLVYLLSVKRPISEMLDPLPKDQRILFQHELEGMNPSIPSYAVLSEVRVRLMGALQAQLTNEERLFLLSFKKGEPEWEKSGVPNIENFPAVKWKLFNVQKMDQEMI